MKILIVDDSPAMRRIVQRTLRQAGFDDLDVVEAENGKKGLEMVEQEGPDMILSDWNMPEMGGLDFLKALRGQGSALPFGFITSESTGDMKQLAIEAGANFILKKPFSSDDLKLALSDHLG